MNKQLATWQLIEKSLLKNLPVMLLYVVESHGSSPGRQGFSMAVNAEGELRGSIGGGIMEHKLVEMAKEMLSRKSQDTRLKTILKKQIHNKTAPENQSGMICSGEQTILFHPISAAEMLPTQQIIACLEKNKNGYFQLIENNLVFSEKPIFDKNSPLGNFGASIGYKNRLHIVGSGHCSLALSQMMSLLDFHISLYDDRQSLNTFDENIFVHQKIIVKDYSELGNLIHSAENNFVVIMTFSYRTDDIAIRALLDKDFKYFGVLGSKNKVKKMLQDYADEGISVALLNKIHSPIGLQIHSKTPEEIAVSIAAQIIQVKNLGSI